MAACLFNQVRRTQSGADNLVASSYRRSTHVEDALRRRGMVRKQVLQGVDQPQGLGDMLGIGASLFRRPGRLARHARKERHAAILQGANRCLPAAVTPHLPGHQDFGCARFAHHDLRSRWRQRWTCFPLASSFSIARVASCTPTRAGDRQTRTGNALRIVNNRLSPIDRPANVALVEALSWVTSGNNSSNSGAHSIALPGSDGEGLIATIMPVDQGHRRSLMAPWAAKVAVFSKSRRHPADARRSIAKLYGLTGGELRVALAMAPGLSAKEAADVLGLSEATVRNASAARVSEDGHFQAV